MEKYDEIDEMLSRWRYIVYDPDHVCDHECFDKWIVCIDEKRDIYGCKKGGNVHFCVGDRDCTNVIINTDESYVCIYSGAIVGIHIDSSQSKAPRANITGKSMDMAREMNLTHKYEQPFKPRITAAEAAAALELLSSNGKDIVPYGGDNNNNVNSGTMMMEIEMEMIMKKAKGKGKTKKSPRVRKEAAAEGVRLRKEERERQQLLNKVIRQENKRKERDILNALKKAKTLASSIPAPADTVSKKRKRPTKKEASVEEEVVVVGGAVKKGKKKKKVTKEGEEGKGEGEKKQNDKKKKKKHHHHHRGRGDDKGNNKKKKGKSPITATEGNTPSAPIHTTTPPLPPPNTTHKEAAAEITLASLSAESKVILTQIQLVLELFVWNNDLRGQVIDKERRDALNHIRDYVRRRIRVENRLPAVEDVDRMYDSMQKRWSALLERMIPENHIREGTAQRIALYIFQLWQVLFDDSSTIKTYTFATGIIYLLRDGYQHPSSEFYITPHPYIVNHIVEIQTILKYKEKVGHQLDDEEESEEEEEESEDEEEEGGIHMKTSQFITMTVDQTLINRSSVNNAVKCVKNVLNKVAVSMAQIPPVLLNYF